MDLRDLDCENGDGTGSESCPMAVFGVSSVERSGSATRVS